VEPTGRLGNVDSLFVAGVAFTGDALVTVGAQGRVSTWNRKTLKPRATGELQVPSTAEVAFAAGRPLLAVAADDGIVSLANPLTGEPFGNVQLNADVSTVALSGDGARLVVGTSDGQVQFWDTAQRRPVGQTAGDHDGRVAAADVSADGSRVVTGGEDGRVRLWDAATGRELNELDIRAGLHGRIQRRRQTLGSAHGPRARTTRRRPRHDGPGRRVLTGRARARDGER
jgi:WD40 repeat protein